MKDESKDHGKPPVPIFINTEDFQVDDKDLGYEEVIRLAFPEGPFTEEWTYTVTYSFAHGGGGDLVAGGDSVKVKKEMSFVVGRSHRS